MLTLKLNSIANKRQWSVCIFAHGLFFVLNFRVGSNWKYNLNFYIESVVVKSGGVLERISLWFSLKHQSLCTSLVTFINRRMTDQLGSFILEASRDGLRLCPFPFWLSYELAPWPEPEGVREANSNAQSLITGIFTVEIPRVGSVSNHLLADQKLESSQISDPQKGIWPFVLNYTESLLSSALLSLLTKVVVTRSPPYITVTWKSMVIDEIVPLLNLKFPEDKGSFHKINSIIKRIPCFFLVARKIQTFSISIPPFALTSLKCRGKDQGEFSPKLKTILNNMSYFATQHVKGVGFANNTPNYSLIEGYGVTTPIISQVRYKIFHFSISKVGEFKTSQNTHSNLRKGLLSTFLLKQESSFPLGYVFTQGGGIDNGIING